MSKAGGGEEGPKEREGEDGGQAVGDDVDDVE